MLGKNIVSSSHTDHTSTCQPSASGTPERVTPQQEQQQPWCSPTGNLDAIYKLLQDELRQLLMVQDLLFWGLFWMASESGFTT